MNTKAVKFGIISDTHGFFHPGLREAFAGVDYIIHAGDIGYGDVLGPLGLIAPVVAVRGNIDGEEYFDYPKMEHRNCGGVRVTVIHNAGDVVHPVADLKTRILAEPTDLLVSGHYHGYWVKQIGMDYGKVLWLSPGAAGNAGHHTGRMALILTVPPVGMADAKLEKVHLGKRGEI